MQLFFWASCKAASSAQAGAASVTTVNAMSEASFMGILDKVDEEVRQTILRGLSVICVKLCL
jgi:hypothetical protein